jgi:hypothetical protein
MGDDHDGVLRGRMVSKSVLDAATGLASLVGLI